MRDQMLSELDTEIEKQIQINRQLYESMKSSGIFNDEVRDSKSSLNWKVMLEAERGIVIIAQHNSQYSSINSSIKGYE